MTPETGYTPDEQQRQHTLAPALQPHEIASLFPTMSSEDVTLVWNTLRGRALEEVRQDRKTRWLLNGEDVLTDEGGSQVKFPGESYFDVIDQQSGSAWVSSSVQGRRLKFRAGGGGADCMFDYLVSSCWATEVAAGRGTEGQEFTSLTGCVFKVYSTIQGAATAHGAAGNNADEVMFICPATYEEQVTISCGTNSTLVIRGAGAQATRIKPTVAMSGNAVSISTLVGDTFIDIRDLTIDASAMSGSNPTSLNTGSACQLLISDCTIQMASAGRGISLGANPSSSVGFLVSHCVFKGSGTGFRASGAVVSQSMIGNCSFASDTTTGVLVQTSGQAMSVVNNRFAGTTGVDIQTSAAGELTISGNVFYDNTTGVKATTLAFGTTAYAVGISGNAFLYCTTGVDLSDVTTGGVLNGAAVNSNVFRTTSGADVGVKLHATRVQNSQLNGNTFSGYTSPNEVSGQTLAQAVTAGNQIVHNTTTSGTPVIDTHGSYLAVPGMLYSIVEYVFIPDAAPAAVITAGDAQGVILHSGPTAETATKLMLDAETAPGASGLPVTVQYGDTDDLDTVASWTTIATATLSSEKSTNTSSMSNATIPADRLLRMNVGTIVGSPTDLSVTLRAKRPLTT